MASASQPRSRKRPLVNTAPLDEFGAAKPEDFDDPAGVAHDVTYVPGFSEMRRERDLQLGEYARNERRGQDVTTLPVNVRLVRASSVNGIPQGLNLMRAQATGYRPITNADLGQPWFTKVPPGARELPDGTFMTAAGDAIYTVATAEAAAKSAARKRRAGEQQLATLGEDDRGLASVARKEAGVTDPTISIT